MGNRDLLQNAAPEPIADENESGFSLISNQKLQDIYAGMLRMRVLAERSFSSLGNGKLATRSEAIVAGVTIDLLSVDTILSSPQNFLDGFFCAVPFQALSSSERRDRAGFLTPSSGPAARFNLAISVALTAKVGGADSIAVVFAEAREFSSAPAQAALAFAGAQELPLIFVCDSMKAAGRSGTVSIADRAKASAVPAIAVDGNDAVAVYRVAFESISRARHGRGPTLIECRTFRVQTRSGSSRAASAISGKVAPADVVAAQNDPVAQMERYLLNKGIFGAEDKASARNGFINHPDRILADVREVGS